MGNVRAKRGTLFFDFRYHGARCREYTKLPDTAANRRRMQRVLDKIEQAIATGTFRYTDFFPGSKLAAKFSVDTDAPVPADPAASPAQSATPLFRSFIEEWFNESLPGWRQSHIATIRSTLDLHLIPWFGDKPVASITKADILQFRAQLAQRKGRGANATLSAKTINRVTQILHQALDEAGDRYGFANPAAHGRRLKQRRVDIHPFSLTETRRIIETVRADYRPYMTVRFLTAMRTGEIHVTCPQSPYHG